MKKSTYIPTIYHPEIELVYINVGSEAVGSHVSYYNDGDLILIGSNLPHCSFTDEETGNKKETVIQMKPDFFGRMLFLKFRNDKY
jgi:hypothetical protein